MALVSGRSHVFRSEPGGASAEWVAGQRMGDEMSIEDAVERLDEPVARRLLVNAAEWHEDVVRAVRLAAADDSDRLAVLTAAVDDGLRTRRNRIAYHRKHRTDPSP